MMTWIRSTAAISTVYALALLGACHDAAAEKADRDRPAQIEANRMTADDQKRTSTFEGNVVLTKGTLNLRADRIVVRQDADGFQHASATGSPIRFRQRADPRDGREAVWIEGEARRIEYDNRTERVELFDQARILRGQDEVRGNYILLDQRSEYFSVSAGKGSAEGRVRAVIQPRSPADAGPATRGTPGPQTPQ